MKLSIVVPVYNEKRTIDQILERIGKTPYEKEIIIVDDYSKDVHEKSFTRWRSAAASLRPASSIIL